MPSKHEFVTIHNRLIDHPESYEKIDHKSEKLLYILFDELHRIKNHAFKVGKQHGLTDKQVRKHYPDLLKDTAYRTVSVTRKELLDRLGKNYCQKNINNLIKQVLSLLNVIYRTGISDGESLTIEQALLIRRLSIDGFFITDRDPDKLSKNKGGNPFEKKIEITFSQEMVTNFYDNFHELDGATLKRIKDGFGARAFAMLSRGAEKTKALGKPWKLPESTPKQVKKILPKIIDITGVSVEYKAGTIYQKGAAPKKTAKQKARADRDRFEKLKRDFQKHAEAVKQAQESAPGDNSAPAVVDGLKVREQFLKNAPEALRAIYEKHAAGEKLTGDELKHYKQSQKEILKLQDKAEKESKKQ